MSTTPQVIQIAILALLAGLAVPLLVQLFLTLRTLQRSVLTLERRLDEMSRELTGILTDLRPSTKGSDTLATVAGVVVPAVVAAIRAYRADGAGRGEDAGAAIKNGAGAAPAEEDGPPEPRGRTGGEAPSAAR